MTKENEELLKKKAKVFGTAPTLSTGVDTDEQIEGLDKSYVNDVRNRGGQYADDALQYGKDYADKNLAYNQTLKEFNDTITNFAERPLDEKEKAKRERSATAIGGIGALGNVASAFSNLVWAGQGAPSQTLPQTPDAGATIDKFREDERAKVKNYIDNAAKKLSLAKAERDYEMTRRDADRNYAMAYAKAQRDAVKDQYTIANTAAQARYHNAQAESEETKAKYATSLAEADLAGKNALVEQRKTAAGLNRANTSAAGARAAASRSTSEYNNARTNALRKGTAIPVTAADGTIRNYYTGVEGLQNMKQLFDMVPESDAKIIAERDLRNAANNPKATQAVYQQFIANQIKTNPEVMIMAEEMGLIDKPQTKKGKKKIFE